MSKWLFVLSAPHLQYPKHDRACEEYSADVEREYRERGFGKYFRAHEPHAGRDEWRHERDCNTDARHGAADFRPHQSVGGDGAGDEGDEDIEEIIRRERNEDSADVPIEILDGDACAERGHGESD